MIIKRKPTRELNLGGVLIGNSYPVSIQSMTTTQTQDTKATLAQLEALKQNGADIVRVAVLNQLDANNLGTLVKESPVPIVADIHYNADFALKALHARVPGLRLNPGNLHDQDLIKKIVEKAKEYNPVIRIGVNGGSLDKSKYPESNAQNIVDSAFAHIRLLEQYDYTNIKVSLKSSDVLTAVEAYRLFSSLSDYPLHLGITEAGDQFSSAVLSSIGLGALLMEGIGDTVRISSAGDPLVEPKIAKEILLALHLTQGIRLIGCPTCGRKNIEVDKIIGLLRDALSFYKKSLTISIMGCVVNGLGEALHSDIGIVGIKGVCEIYHLGKRAISIKAPYTEKDVVNAVVKIIADYEG